MSEFLASAAQKMGVPEPIVSRSAAARAQAAGVDTDAILSAWAGGESAPAASKPAPEPEPATETAPEPDTSETPATDTPPPAATPEPAPSAPVRVAAGPRVPPVLVGRTERLAGTVAGVVALLALSLLVGFAVASTPEETNLAYTSNVPYSATALDGRDVYLSQGCAACHTQLVRPVVADATFGGVSMSDTNQVIGSRRIGPDLAHVGSRLESDAAASAILSGAGGHPSFSGLSDGDLDALVAYLMESK
ncbi:MAG: cbb3-type cytochrome c oxidase subunit II [Acidimicrobiia bacterium]|nr:cbb3-type cytochrome c oxidase subunit II [Acidimicrobiia bacterium]